MKNENDLKITSATEEGFSRNVFFETHAHYDHTLFKGQGPEVVRELKESGIERIVIPAITLESNQAAREMFDEEHFPFVYFASGIHPKVASSIIADRFDWTMISDYLSEKRTVAVKTGLDLANKSLTEKLISNQKAILQHLLRLADEHNLPVVLHVREAVPETVEELKKSGFTGKLEEHCFLYDKNAMYQMLEAGIHYFGIGGAVTRPENAALREAVMNMPLESILLETDAPFQKPFGYSEKLNTSLALDQIAETIAELKGIPKEELIAQAYENSMVFFGTK